MTKRTDRSYSSSGTTIRDGLSGLRPETLWKAVEATRSPLIVTDATMPDQPIIYCNQAFSDLTGYSQQEIIGRNCRFLQGSTTSRRAIRRMHDTLAEHGHIRLQVKNFRKDGQAFWNDLVMSPVFGDDGTLTNYIGLQLDVTDRVTYEQQLKRSQGQLARSNKELEQFTYAASHDLQEPLRMIASYLQLINERYRHKLDDDGEVFMDFALDGAKRMRDLVNDLLTLSRVRTSARTFAAEDLNELLRLAKINLQTLIAEHDATITAEPLPTLRVDRTQIVQLFQNLISNAVKYRRPGVAPHVSISVTEQRSVYQIRVTDNGIGIEPEYFQRIFGVFQRLHTRNEYPGTGVGLAICSKIVERHGGDMTVESTPGQGSTFSFTLPKRPPKGDYHEPE